MKTPQRLLCARLLLVAVCLARPATASTWSRETVLATGDVGRYTSCKVGPSGAVHLSYQDVSNGQVGYIKKTGGTWGPAETPDFSIDGGAWTSLALLPGSDTPRIAYVGTLSVFDGQTSRYASKSGNVWTSEIIGTNSLDQTALALTPAGGTPVIAYHHWDAYAFAGGDCKTASKPGTTWVGDVVYPAVQYVTDNGALPSVAVDPNGVTRVAFNAWNFGSNGRSLAYRSGTAAVEFVDAQCCGPTSISLALDTTNDPAVPCIAYTVNGKLQYAFKSGAVWVLETVDATSTSLLYASLGLAGSGQARIAYYDGVLGDLKYATRTAPGVWTIDTVDAQGDVGQYASLALDGGGRPHISYYDATNGDLKHASQEQTPCGPGSGCVAPPNLMKAWWPFNEALGQAVNIAAPAGGLTNGILMGGAARVPGKVGTALQCNNASQYASIAANGSLDVGIGDFSIDAWVNASPGSDSWTRTIVDKRSGTYSCATGYAFFLFGGKPSVQIGDATCNATFLGSSASIADGTWHHVAVTVQRASTDGGRIWVDGVRTMTFDPTVRPGSLTNTAPLLIGQRASLSPAESFDGMIDEVELWRRAIDSTEVIALWQAGSAGKCVEACYVPGMLTYDASVASPSVAGQATIWNYSATAQTYTWTLTPLPVTGSCNFAANAPNQSGGPVTIPAGGSYTIPYTIPYPAGLTFGQNACYQFTVFNTVSGRCFSSVGHTQYALVASCCTSLSTLAVGTGTEIAFPFVNTAESAVTAQVRIRERCSDGSGTNVLALNGLPPGIPWEASYSLAPQQDAHITLNVTPFDHDPFAVHDLVLEMLSADGTTYQEIADAPVVTALGATTSIAEPGQALDAFRIAANGIGSTARVSFSLAAPSQVEIDVVTAAGRVVRTLAHGRLAAGPHDLVWDGRDGTQRTVASGIYFVRAKSGARVQSLKLVHLR